MGRSPHSLAEVPALPHCIFKWETHPSRHNSQILSHTTRSQTNLENTHHHQT